MSLSEFIQAVPSSESTTSEPPVIILKRDYSQALSEGRQAKGRQEEKEKEEKEKEESTQVMDNPVTEEETTNGAGTSWPELSELSATPHQHMQAGLPETTIGTTVTVPSTTALSVVTTVGQDICTSSSDQSADTMPTVPLPTVPLSTALTTSSISTPVTTSLTATPPTTTTTLTVVHNVELQISESSNVQQSAETPATSSSSAAVLTHTPLTTSSATVISQASMTALTVVTNSGTGPVSSHSAPLTISHGSPHTSTSSGAQFQVPPLEFLNFNLNDPALLSLMNDITFMHDNEITQPEHPANPEPDKGPLDEKQKETEQGSPDAQTDSAITTSAGQPEQSTDLSTPSSGSYNAVVGRSSKPVTPPNIRSNPLSTSGQAPRLRQHNRSDRSRQPSLRKAPPRESQRPSSGRTGSKTNSSTSQKTDSAGAAKPNPPPASPTEKVTGKTEDTESVVSETSSSITPNGEEKSKKQMRRERREQFHQDLAWSAPLSKEEIKKLEEKNEAEARVKEEKRQKQLEARKETQKKRQQEKEEKARTKKQRDEERERLRKETEEKQKREAERKEKEKQAATNSPDQAMVTQQQGGDASGNQPASASQHPAAANVGEFEMVPPLQEVDLSPLDFAGESLTFSSLGDFSDFLVDQLLEGEINVNDLWSIISAEVITQIDSRQLSPSLARLLWIAARGNRLALDYLVQAHDIGLMDNPLRLLRTIRMFWLLGESGLPGTAVISHFDWAEQLSSLLVTEPLLQAPSHTPNIVYDTFVMAMQALIEQRDLSRLVEQLRKEGKDELAGLLEWIWNYDRSNSAPTFDGRPPELIRYLARRVYSSRVHLVVSQSVLHTVVIRLSSLAGEGEKKLDEFLALNRALLSLLGCQNPESGGELEQAVQLLVDNLDEELLRALVGTLSQFEETAHAASLLIFHNRNLNGSKWGEYICRACRKSVYKVHQVQCTESPKCELSCYLCDRCVTKVTDWQCPQNPSCQGSHAHFPTMR